MTYRALLVKAGLDAHERGIHVISRGLRDAGFEVVYLGLRVTPREIARIALDEDVDVVGVSSLAGAHRRTAASLREALEREGIRPVVVFGGVIPAEDDDFLAEHGVDAIFRAGTLMSEIVDTVRSLCESNDAENTDV